MLVKFEPSPENKFAVIVCVVSILPQFLNKPSFVVLWKLISPVGVLSISIKIFSVLFDVFLNLIVLSTPSNPNLNPSTSSVFQNDIVESFAIVGAITLMFVFDVISLCYTFNMSSFVLGRTVPIEILLVVLIESALSFATLLPILNISVPAE